MIEPEYDADDMGEAYSDPRNHLCKVCGARDPFPHDHQPDGSGLDDGPYLPGQAPHKQPEPKSRDEMAEIRARAWATRRRRYGPRGHR